MRLRTCNRRRQRIAARWAELRRVLRDAMSDVPAWTLALPLHVPDLDCSGSVYCMACVVAISDAGRFPNCPVCGARFVPARVLYMQRLGRAYRPDDWATERYRK